MKKVYFYTLLFALLGTFTINCKKAVSEGAKVNKSADKEDPYREAKKLYKIKREKLSYRKGEEASVWFKILLNKGAKVHSKAPFRCKLTAPANLHLAKEKLGHGDKKVSKDKREVTVSVKAKALKNGSGEVSFHCNFYVCTKDICAKTEEKFAVSVEVK